MPRTLHPVLDQLPTSPSVRRPAFRLEIFDLRSGANTMRDLVVGNPILPSTGPLDLTEFVLSVEVAERGGDFIATGVQASSLAITLTDPSDRFNPLNRLLDPSGDGRWLRPGNAVRLYEGDLAVSPASWALTFTGRLQGAPAVSGSRSTSDRVLRLVALDRMADYVDVTRTSVAFPLNSSYLSMAQDVAEIDMQLDAAEVDFAGFGSRTTGHNPTQFVDQSPVTSLAQILMVDGFLPIFGGDGKITQTSATISALPDRIYEDPSPVLAIEQLAADGQVIDAVCVLGLDANLTKVSQPTQDLQEVQITTGYFTQDEDFDIYWSEDRTLVVENPSARVKKSVTGSVNFGGDGESFDFLPAPDSLEGFIGVKVTLSTGFASTILVMLAVHYIGAAWIPDVVLGFVAGETIPLGRVVQALVLIGILILMTQIGRLHVVFRGRPIEYVYKEIRACAELEEPLAETYHRVEIENHLVQDQGTGDALAREILFRQVARANPRRITMLHDLRLIPNDVLEVADPVYGERRFLFHEIQRTLRRGELPVATVAASEITGGLLP